MLFFGLSGQSYFTNIIFKFTLITNTLWTASEISDDYYYNFRLIFDL